MGVGQWVERGDVWMESAGALKLRLRELFRVAVDHHRRRPMASDGYLTSTLQRCLHRFRTHSLCPSSTLYRKKVSKDIIEEEDSVLTRLLQAVAAPVIGNVCHVFMHGLNRVQIYGAEKLHSALLDRPENKPLITVSNHVASMDDPLVIASLLPRSILFDAHSLRWTLCATDRCFRNPVTSAFFKYVKVLPVSRGDGIYQKGMDMAISKLNRGGWVHIFPEGSRSRDGGRTMGSVKRGIGRLILDADNVPMVVPFVHTGMQEIMPIGAKLPRIGKTVTVLVGDPINFDDLFDVEEKQNVSRGKLYDAVSWRIGDRLKKLKAQVDRLAIEQSENYKRAAGILHQVDWESLGMESYVGAEEDYSSPKRQYSSAEPKVNVTHAQENASRSRMGFSYEGGIVSRIRGYMDPSELMVFAARGLFLNRRVKENFASAQGVGPSKVWNNFWRLMDDNHTNSVMAS